MCTETENQSYSLLSHVVRLNGGLGRPDYAWPMIERVGKAMASLSTAAVEIEGGRLAVGKGVGMRWGLEVGEAHAGKTVRHELRFRCL